jgi:hypothetical protein
MIVQFRALIELFNANPPRMTVEDWVITITTNAPIDTVVFSKIDIPPRCFRISGSIRPRDWTGLADLADIPYRHLCSPERPWNAAYDRLGRSPMLGGNFAPPLLNYFSVGLVRGFGGNFGCGLFA